MDTALQEEQTTSTEHGLDRVVAVTSGGILAVFVIAAIVPDTMGGLVDHGFKASGVC